MQLPVLSFTNMNDYQVCPRRFYHKHVAKDLPPEEKSKEQLEGTAVHEALKRRIRLREPLPEDYAKWEPLCAELDTDDYVKYTELKLGVHRDGGSCDFFLAGVWLRGALDLVLNGAGQAALIIDWKTGKEREDPFELAVQALLLKRRWPELTRITGHYVWLRGNGGAGKIGAAHDVSDTERTLRTVQAAEASMTRRLASNDWPPDEGPLCAWCSVLKSMCEFKRERPQ
jgi:hypothetical protein